MIPLVSSVLFPGGVLSLQVGIDRNVRLLQNIGEAQQRIAAFCQVRGDRENPQASDLSRVGVLAAIVQRLPVSSDRYQLFLQGLQRVELVEMVRTEPYFEAVVRPIDRGPLPASAHEGELVLRALSHFERLVDADSRYSPELVNTLRMNADRGAGAFADLMAALVNLPLEERQELLATGASIERIDKLIEFVQRDVARATIERDLRSQVNSTMERRERESYLREQLRLIQEELGDTESLEREADTYRRRLEALPVPPESHEQLLREVSRLSLMSSTSPDYGVIKTHLDTVLDVPWVSPQVSGVDVKSAARVLETQHDGLERAKERILEYLAVLGLKGDLPGPILCFAGPPGVGKTSLGQAIAEALGRRFLRMSVGGVTDEAEIRGHRKAYIGAMPGKVIQSFIQAGVNNPLVMIDEIDKMGRDYRGDPAAALLEVLDPEQNHAFVDRYLEIPFDLSRALFITTANVLDSVPSPLRDRMEVIEFSGYTDLEKLRIARNHLVPKTLRAHGLDRRQFRIDDAAILRIVRDYTAEAGVRRLTQLLSTIIRKVTRRVATGEVDRTRIRAEEIETYLGLPSFEHEFAERRAEIGVSTGLAWTSTGGEIMFIEATRMTGTGKTLITGHLGDVMRESVHAAYSYVRSKAGDLGIPDEVFSTSDVHIHFPAASVPKDGPSAGVAIATTIASVMGDVPVRHGVAMTGEITLRGKVLSVGGVKEKTLAAHRANVRTVILPEGNRKDLAEVPAEVRKRLRFVFAPRVEDVWREALIRTSGPKPRKRKAE